MIFIRGIKNPVYDFNLLCHDITDRNAQLLVVCSFLYVFQWSNWCDSAQLEKEYN